MQSAYRLRKSWEFAEVIEKGKKIISSGIVIFYFPNQLNNCRFGISVPRKLVKKAAQRNYYKRQVKSILIKHKDFCQTLPLNHYNLVIIIRPGFLVADQFSAKQNSLIGLFDLIFQKEPSFD